MFFLLLLFLMRACEIIFSFPLFHLRGIASSVQEAPFMASTSISQEHLQIPSLFPSTGSSAGDGLGELPSSWLTPALSPSWTTDTSGQSWLVTIPSLENSVFHDTTTSYISVPPSEITIESVLKERPFFEDDNQPLKKRYMYSRVSRPRKTETEILRNSNRPAAAPAPPGASSPMEIDDVEVLVAMGFEKQMATNTLLSHNNDLAAALDELQRWKKSRDEEEQRQKKLQEEQRKRLLQQEIQRKQEELRKKQLLKAAPAPKNQKGTKSLTALRNATQQQQLQNFQRDMQSAEAKFFQQASAGRNMSPNKNSVAEARMTYPYQFQELKSAGFGESEIASALTMTNGNIHQAIDLLLSDA